MTKAEQIYGKPAARRKQSGRSAGFHSLSCAGLPSGLCDGSSPSIPRDDSHTGSLCGFSPGRLSNPTANRVRSSTKKRNSRVSERKHQSRTQVEELPCTHSNWAHPDGVRHIKSWWPWYLRQTQQRSAPCWAGVCIIPRKMLGSGKGFPRGCLIQYSQFLAP